MKQIWKYLIVALAGLSLLACNKEQDTPVEEENPSADSYSYTIAIDVADTKAYLDGDHMTWDEEDGEYNAIGWFATATMYNGVPEEVSGYSPINLNANPRTFTVNTHSRIDQGKAIYAYAPCSYEETSSKEAVQLSIPTVQDGVIRNAMPMVSLPIPVAVTIPLNTDRTIGTARFINLGAVIDYQVYTSDVAYADENVVSVTFNATEPLAGDFSVNLTQVAEDAIPAPSELTESRVRSQLDRPVTVGGSVDNAVNVYQVVAPGTWSGTISVTTDAAIYEYAVTDLEFNRGSIRPIRVNLASTNATRRDLSALTAHPWVVEHVAADWGQGPDDDIHGGIGNKITFQADGSLAFDCSANEEFSYDYSSGDLFIPEDVDQMNWSVAGTAIEFMGYPLFTWGDDTPYVWQIETLDENQLVLSAEVWGGTYYLTFVSESQYRMNRLTAHEWVLTGYEVEWSEEYGLVDSAEGATLGNSIQFNTDYSLAFDCSANNGLTHDYYFTGEDFEPYSVDQMSWALDGDKLVFPEGSFPLIILDAGEMSFDIEELNATRLVLSCVLWDTYLAIITFDAPSAAPDPEVAEELLTATSWELSAVTRGGEDVTQSAGNIMTLHTDNSFSFDCSANNGQVYDYYYDGGWANPDFSHWNDGSYWEGATLQWSVSQQAGNTLLNFTTLAYPLVIVDGCITAPLSYEIITLDSSSLVLHHDGDGGDFTISFTAVSPEPM